MARSASAITEARPPTRSAATGRQPATAQRTERRGRPRALNINPAPVTELAQRRGLTLNQLARAADISAPHLNEVLNHAKGLAPAAVLRLANVLRCSPETIAPTLTNRFRAVRPGDPDF